MVLTSSNAVQYSFEGDEVTGEGVRSVFTRVLVQGLETGNADRDRDGHIFLDELYEYVYECVVDETPKQRPQMFATVEGKIFIARNPALSVPPSVQVPGEAPPPRAPQTAPAKTQPPLLQRETEQYKVLSPDRITWKKDSKEMVRVPAGKFLYGYQKEERKLPEFWIDKTPVTNAEYARFVAATGRNQPRHWKGKTPPGDIASHPVVYVTWHNAVAYTEWAGKRLPTEQEWEKAARGTYGREYPWGDWEEDRCNAKEAGIGTTTPAGQYSPGGDSPYGCVDMAGNVWEWTAPKFLFVLTVVCGGSFRSNRSNTNCAHHSFDHLLSSFDNYGFRCVSPVSLS